LLKFLWVAAGRSFIMSSVKIQNKSIGLCLSGGGHRASIFSLGALLYLVDADRHRDIRVISSVSGGSLTSGFVAAQSNPIHIMDRAEFDACAARWARQIAGSPRWWYGVVVIHAVLFLLWALFICMSWGWLPSWLAWLFPFGGPWWAVQVGYVASLFLCARLIGHLPGGTIWGWWGTWMYLGVIAPALFFVIFVWWSPLSCGWRLLLFALAICWIVCALGLRSVMADLSFRATVFGDQSLCAIHPVPLHVFCATEMQTGRPAFFSHNFIYTHYAGLGSPADLPLSTAVQFSANFPVAFPYRFLRLEKHDFQLGSNVSSESWKKLRPFSLEHLVLSDGGLQDNTGVIWFQEASERRTTLTRRLLESTDQANQRIQGQLASMAIRPDLLIVVNSSYPPGWTTAGRLSVPVLGEIAALIGVQRVMYNQRGREQSRQLRHRFVERSKEGAGALVSIEEHPGWVNYALAYDMRTALDDLGISDLNRQLRAYKKRARAAISRFNFGPTVPAPPERLPERSRELANRILAREQESDKLETEGRWEDNARVELEIENLETEKFQVDNNISAIEQLERMQAALREADNRSMETRVVRDVPTTLRPLGVDTTAALLRHGYLNCMSICSLLLEEFPSFDDPPSLDEMQKLARGLPRARHPSRFGPSVPVEADKPTLG
jgi:hypothetical protein